MTAGSKNGTGLRAIIAYIDYVDHSIISWKELSNGLTRLMNIGAVIEKNKKLFLSGKFKTWWLSYYQNKKGLAVLKQVDDVNGYLDKTYSAIRDHQHTKIELTENDFLMALKEYKKL